MSTSNPLVEMFGKIRLTIAERLEHGSLDYAGDTTTLKKHLQLAHEMNNPILVGATLNMLGQIEDKVGHFQVAEAYLVEGVSITEPTQEPRLLLALYNNLGELYKRMGQFDLAIDAYQKADIYLANIKHNAGLVATLENNTGQGWLALGNLEKAQKHLQAVVDMFRNEASDLRTLQGFVSAYIEALYSLAEIHLAREHFQAAWQAIEDAERLAITGDFKYTLAPIYITKAHIATRDPERQGEVASFYKAARESLRINGTPLFLARTLLSEARYQHSRQQAEETLRLAHEALSIFQELGLEGEVALTQQIIDSASKLSHSKVQN